MHSEPFFWGYKHHLRARANNFSLLWHSFDERKPVNSRDISPLTNFRIYLCKNVRIDKHPDAEVVFPAFIPCKFVNILIDRFEQKVYVLQSFACTLLVLKVFVIRLATFYFVCYVSTSLGNKFICQKCESFCL